MARLKLKPERPKLRRSGNRLTETNGQQRLVHVLHRGSWRVTEASRPNESYSVTYSRSGRYALAKGMLNDAPVQHVLDGGFFGELVAFRSDNEHAWLFIDRATGKLMISVAEAGIRNAALVASALAEHRLTGELAKFINVSPMLCYLNDVSEIHNNPRYKALRNFEFKFVSTVRVDTSEKRDVEKAIRHEQTNYDEMLRVGGRDVGGLMYPPEYERLKKGVNTIVASRCGVP
jgi:hypothetical protein